MEWGEIFNISGKGGEPYMGRPGILLGNLITLENMLYYLALISL